MFDGVEGGVPVAAGVESGVGSGVAPGSSTVSIYSVNPDMSVSVNVYPVLIPAIASVSAINLFRSL